MEYKCAKCGSPAIVGKNKIVRTCGHDTAPVTANCSATCKGTSKVK